MADNRLYGGDVVNPAMLGQVSVSPQQKSLEGYTGSGASPYVVNQQVSQEFDPYYRLKGNFLKMAGKTFEMGIEAEKNKAYVDGMSKAISGQAEDEINSNILTRNWGRAGYRDTEGRLALIDYKSTALNDLANDPDLQSMTPEAFQKYLVDSKEKVMGFINNASTETQQKLLEQLVAEDASLISKQAEAFQSYRLNQEVGLVGRELNLNLLELNDSYGSPARYEIAIGKTAMNIERVLNSSLSPDAQQKIVKDYLNTLSANGHPDAVTFLTSQGSFNVGGTQMGLAEALPFDTFHNIVEGERKGKKAAYNDRMKNTVLGIQAMMEQAETDPDFDFNGAIKYISDNISTTDLKLSEGKQYIKKLSDIRRSRTNSLDVLGAVERGDYEYLRVNGVSPNKGVTEFMKSMKDAPVTEKLQRLLGVSTMGMSEALGGIGDIAQPTFAKIMNTDAPLTEEDQAVMNTLIDLFNTEDFHSNPQAKFNNILSGVKDTTTAAFMDGAFNRFISNDLSVMNGEQQSAGWANAVAAQKDYMESNPYFKQGMEARLSQTIDYISEANTGETYGALNPFRASLLGDDASKAIKPRTQFGEWFGFGRANTELNNMVTDTFSDYQKMLAERAVRAGAIGDPKSIAKIAGIEVGKASFYMSGDNFKGSFVGMPKQTISDMYSTIGIETGGLDYGVVAQDVVNKLAGEYTNQIGRGDLKIQATFENGNLVLRGINSDGIAQDTYRYTSNQLIQEAQEYVEGKVLETDSAYGDGYSVFVPTSNSVYRSGNMPTRIGDEPSTSRKHVNDIEVKVNSVMPRGKEVDWDKEDIIAIRSSLINYERIRTRRYKDGVNEDKTPKYSVGVGINEGNDYFPKRIAKDSDEITEKELNDSFTKASAAAIKAASKHVNELPSYMDKSAYKMLLTHLVYQQGNVTKDHTQRVRRAIVEGDKEKAKELFKSTPAWSYSGDERRGFYLKLIDNL